MDDQFQPAALVVLGLGVAGGRAGEAALRGDPQPVGGYVGGGLEPGEQLVDWLQPGVLVLTRRRTTPTSSGADRRVVKSPAGGGLQLGAEVAGSEVTTPRIWLQAGHFVVGEDQWGWE